MLVGRMAVTLKCELVAAHYVQNGHTHTHTPCTSHTHTHTHTEPQLNEFCVFIKQAKYIRNSKDRPRPGRRPGDVIRRRRGGGGEQCVCVYVSVGVWLCSILLSQ